MVPLLQKLLPLLDGNVASVVANLLVPRMLAPTVDMHPIEARLASLREELAAIHGKHAEQGASLKRIEDQLESVKDALESAALEQKETMQQVGRVQKRVLVFSLVGLSLLVISVALDVVLFVRFGQGAH
jgi:tetrahydromethanopterin S-methyltransferase subunit G